MLLDIQLPKHPIGTKFIYRNGKQKVEATVVGYHVEHNTESNYTNVTYRISYRFAGLQDITATVARSTVDRGLADTN